MTTMMQALMALDDGALGELFRLRPDLASPAPAGFAELADRASRPRSLQAAYAGLDHFSGVVLQGCCVIDDGAKPEALMALLGGPGRCPPEAVEAALGRLAARALLWRGEGGAIHPAPALHGAFRYPLGLGRPLAVLVGQGSTTVADLEKALVRLGLPGKQPGERKADLVARLAGVVGDAELVGGVLASAPEAVRQLADRLAEGRPTVPVQRSYARGVSPYEWLAERLLVVPFDWYQAEMPREVGLAVRGGDARVVDLAWDRPAVVASTPDPAMVVAAARAAAAESVRAVEAILEAWSCGPPAALKAGGIGVRDLKRAAQAAGCPDADVGVYVEVAAAAGLVRQAGELFLPTADYDTWRGGEPAQRWLRLATGWLAAGRVPSLAGDRDADDKPIAALNPKFAVRAAAEARAAVLAAVGTAAGSAPHPKSLAAALRWDTPGTWDALPLATGTAVDMVLREASLLGVTGAGTLSPWGAELAAGRYAAALAAAEVLGRNEATVTIQADLTAVAAGPVGAELAAELALMADVESRGAATVWRFSDRSLGRAFDAGRSAEDIVGFLAAHAAKGVPQTLEYLVGDVARRHGRIRAGSVRSYVRSDDPAVVAELCGTKKLRRCGLRAVAPMVAVAAVDAAALVVALREAGFLAVEEDPGGATVVRAPVRNRAASPEAPAATPRPSRGGRPSPSSAGAPKAARPEGLVFWVTGVDGAPAHVDVAGLVVQLRAVGRGPTGPARRDPRTGRIAGVVPIRPDLRARYPDPMVSPFDDGPDEDDPYLSINVDDLDDLEFDVDDDVRGVYPACDCPDCRAVAASGLDDLIALARERAKLEVLSGDDAEWAALLDDARRDGRPLLIAYDHPRRGPNVDVVTVLQVTGTTAHVRDSSGREQLVDVDWIEAVGEAGARRRGGRRRRGRR